MNKLQEPLDLQRYFDVARRRYPYFLLAVFLVGVGLAEQAGSYL